MCSMSTSLTNHIWVYEPPSIEKIRHLQLHHKLSLLAAKCLANQLQDIPVEDWLSPSMEHLHDPFLMLGMDKAVPRLLKAIEEDECILIVTDYDADGTTSCLVLRSICALLGAKKEKLFTKITTRAEGYGFALYAVDYAKEIQANLIITADIGVRDHIAVNAAKELGIDVIICDHHLPPGESVPKNAFAVLCPPQDGCTYPNPSLAACGVSFKLAQGLLQRTTKEVKNVDRVLRALLKVVAIGTVADVVSLATLENRAIVSLGMKALVDRHLPNKPGLQALLKVSGTEEYISSQDIGFKVAPRINAAGRMANASLVEQLFFSQQDGEALELAKKLNTLNEQRKEVQNQMLDELAGRIQEPLPNFIVMGGGKEDGFHKGVSGIVAARLRDQFHRPTAIYTTVGDILIGSIRSIGKIHAVQALDRCKHILLKYGGHAVAAGFSIHKDHLVEFTTILNNFVAEIMDGTELLPVHYCTMKCSIQELTFAAVNQLMALEPFGKDNYKPVIWLTNIRPKNIMVMGQQRQHIKFTIGDMEMVWWNANEYKEILQRDMFDFLIEVGFNRFNQQTKIQCNIVDAMASAVVDTVVVESTSSVVSSALEM